jgi:hypothetical protein
VEIDRAEVQGEGGFVEIPLVGAVNGVVTLDLLQLRSGVEESLAIGTLPVGTYHQIRLHIVSATLQFTDASPEQPFVIPSGMQSGLKINVQPHFVISDGQTTPIVLDFDVANSFHVTASGGDPTCDDLKSGEGTVHFNPVVRAMVVDATGVIAGFVRNDVPEPVADVEVSAFPAGTVVDADSVPVATTFSAPSGLVEAEEGSYALRLDPGDYDLYVRAQGVEARTLAASAVNVVAGATTNVDLTIP